MPIMEKVNEELRVICPEFDKFQEKMESSSEDIELNSKLEELLDKCEA